MQDRSLAHIAKECPDLQSVNLRARWDISELQAFSDVYHPWLRKLELHSSFPHFQKAPLQSLFANCPHLILVWLRAWMDDDAENYLKWSIPGAESLPDILDVEELP